jgi:hypothetical protein
MAAHADYVTITEAAEILGTTPDAVHEAIRAGTLRAYVLDRELAAAALASNGQGSPRVQLKEYQPDQSTNGDYNDALVITDPLAIADYVREHIFAGIVVPPIADILREVREGDEW